MSKRGRVKPIARQRRADDSQNRQHEPFAVAAKPSRYQEQVAASTSRPSGGKPPKGAGSRRLRSKPPIVRRKRLLPSKVTPRYVAECSRNGGRSFSQYSWRRERPRSVQRRAYCCGSWRCDGDCQRHAAAVLFARLLEAISRPEFDPNGWVFFVLTLDRDGRYSGKPWADVNEAFGALSRNTNRFLKRYRRLCRDVGWRVLGSEWVIVIEAHKSGWPHANLLVYAPEHAAYLEGVRTRRIAEGAAERAAILLEGEVLRHAIESGWGPRSSAERVRHGAAVTSYLVKLAGRADAIKAEIAKTTQAPLAAPAGFRRLRSGTAFLPPRRKNPGFTGTLIKRQRDPQRSAYAAAPVRAHKQSEIAAKCAELEERRIEAEAGARRAAKRLGIPYRLIERLLFPRAQVLRLDEDTDQSERPCAPTGKRPRRPR